MEKKYDILLLEDGAEYKTELSDKFLKRKKWETPDPRKIFSFIPGQILELNVKPGQKVKAGEKLLILEAMKMRNQITAENSGTVKNVYVTLNQNIPKNFLILEFE
jgi:propionyl-CoA carboxylase alpha chain